MKMSQNKDRISSFINRNYFRIVLNAIIVSLLLFNNLSGLIKFILVLVLMIIIGSYIFDIIFKRNIYKFAYIERIVIYFISGFLLLTFISFILNYSKLGVTFTNVWILLGLLNLLMVLITKSNINIISNKNNFKYDSFTFILSLLLILELSLIFFLIFETKIPYNFSFYPFAFINLIPPFFWINTIFIIPFLILGLFKFYKKEVLPINTFLYIILILLVTFIAFGAPALISGHIIHADSYRHYSSGTNLINSDIISEQGKDSAIYDDYYRLPAFAFFVSVFQVLYNSDYNMVLFILPLLMHSVIVLLIFLLANVLFNNRVISILAVLLYSFNVIKTLHLCPYLVSIIFVLFILYIILKTQYFLNLKIIIYTTLLMFLLVTIHAFSPVLLFIVLVGIFLANKVFKKHFYKSINVIFIIILPLLILSWWFLNNDPNLEYNIILVKNFFNDAHQTVYKAYPSATPPAGLQEFKIDISDSILPYNLILTTDPFSETNDSTKILSYSDQFIILKNFNYIFLSVLLVICLITFILQFKYRYNFFNYTLILVLLFILTLLFILFKINAIGFLERLENYIRIFLPILVSFSLYIILDLIEYSKRRIKLFLSTLILIFLIILGFLSPLINYQSGIAIELFTPVDSQEINFLSQNSKDGSFITGDSRLYSELELESKIYNKKKFHTDRFIYNEFESRAKYDSGDPYFSNYIILSRTSDAYIGGVHGIGYNNYYNYVSKINNLPDLNKIYSNGGNLIYFNNFY